MISERSLCQKFVLLTSVDSKVFSAIQRCFEKQVIWQFELNLYKHYGRMSSFLASFQEFYIHFKLFSPSFNHFPDQIPFTVNLFHIFIAPLDCVTCNDYMPLDCCCECRFCSVVGTCKGFQNVSMETWTYYRARFSQNL